MRFVYENCNSCIAVTIHHLICCSADDKKTRISSLSFCLRCEIVEICVLACALLLRYLIRVLCRMLSFEVARKEEAQFTIYSSLVEPYLISLQKDNQTSRNTQQLFMLI